MDAMDEQERLKLTKDLKAYAEEEGWDVFGIADPEPLNQAAKAWRRPKDVWYATKAIICVGYPILDKWTKLRFTPPKTGMAAAFGVGWTFAQEKVMKIQSWLEDRGYHYATRPYTFLPTIRQAEAFVQAGLGWVGKNMLFVNPKYGPRLEIGTVFTDAPLIHDARYEGEECGDCTICQQYCPSGAIKGNWRYEAQVCERYINHKGHLQYLSNWGWFECDMCMRKCPIGEVKWELERGKWPDLLRKNYASGIAQTSGHFNVKKTSEKLQKTRKK